MKPPLTLAVALKILLIVLLAGSVPSCTSCDDDDDEFSNSIPVTYYLSGNKKLSTDAGPDGGWQYITNYIYPTGTTSCQWSVHLNHNITKDAYGYDLLFFSATDAVVKIEFILLESSQETLLASKELNVLYINETTAFQHHVELETNPLKGINPRSGKDGELIFRITQISGADPVEIFYDANPGTFGCTLISLYQDQ